MKILTKIDQFYYVFTAVFVFLTVVVIISIRTIFNSLAIAGDIDEDLLSSETPRISRQKLNVALEFIEEKQIEALDLN